MGCTEAHTKHRCYRCGDQDSNHRSKYCPNPTRCKARDCTEAHAKHHCRGCGSEDSNHRWMNCPSKPFTRQGKMCKSCKDRHSADTCRCTKCGSIGTGAIY